MKLDAPSVDTEILLRQARDVLRHCQPGRSLPDELKRIRAVLDVHMFGRDKRASRDAAIAVARQIDRLDASESAA